MAAGYVYVLVNSSIPGLTKVGRTTRLPSERVIELSGATGVPTPFIVAFEQYFADCDAAEQFVHTELERRGLREASNREFFRASANDVIRVVLDAPGQASPLPAISASEDASRDELLSSDDPLPDLKLGDKPWRAILEVADDHYYGHGDTLEDFQEALKLYRDAARLGSSQAYRRIARMYENGEGVREDYERALEFYKGGAQRGNYYCYADMARIFEFRVKIENAKKCWALFFNTRRTKCDEDIEEGSEARDYVWECATYILFCIRQRVEQEFKTDLLALSPPSRRRLAEFLEQLCQRPDAPDRAIETYRTALQWVRLNLPPTEHVASKPSASKSAPAPQQGFAQAVLRVLAPWARNK